MLPACRPGVRDRRASQRHGDVHTSRLRRSDGRYGPALDRTLKRVLLGTLAVILVGSVAAAALRPLGRSRTYQLFGALIDRVDVSDPVVALTFDDGPTPAVMDEILGVLASRTVRATFFVNGHHLDADPDAGRRLVAAGHELGNHGYSHERLVFRSPGFVRRELDRTDEVIRAAGQTGDIFFRPPYGAKLVVLPWVLSRTGRTTIMWDLDPDSSRARSQSGAALAAHVVEHARPGSIVLLHVWYPVRRTSLDAVPLLIDGLHEKGFRFVTVKDLVRLGRRR